MLWMELFVTELSMQFSETAERLQKGLLIKLYTRSQKTFTFNYYYYYLKILPFLQRVGSQGVGFHKNVRRECWIRPAVVHLVQHIAPTTPLNTSLFLMHMA